ncbi:hypothetical protein [Hansschlegelia zhihuaiae]|uniref:hypothetical protein n=1 Tax=Hansschlegelia zhihuaiae TaxID=405005 RepID=UPI0013E8A15C|nr:hypothetical protein [Hansschlegelia zhihuaiae]
MLHLLVMVWESAAEVSLVNISLLDTKGYVPLWVDLRSAAYLIHAEANRGALNFRRA